MTAAADKRTSHTRALAAVGLVSVLGLIPLAGTAQANRIENAVAVFAALDKVTARISKLEVPLDQTVTFGSLKVTPRVCFSRPATEQPKTTSFVEVDEKELEGRRSGFSRAGCLPKAPGLNAVEHPVFDIWLTGCAQPKGGMAAASGSAPLGSRDANALGETDAGEPIITRRRIRR